MTCVKCGAEIKEGTKFCGQCGAEAKKVCKKCNTEVPSGVFFCAMCGTKVQDDNITIDKGAQSPAVETVETKQQEKSLPPVQNKERKEKMPISAAAKKDYFNAVVHYLFFVVGLIMIFVGVYASNNAQAEASEVTKPSWATISAIILLFPLAFYFIVKNISNKKVKIGVAIAGGIIFAAVIVFGFYLTDGALGKGITILIALESLFAALMTFVIVANKNVKIGAGVACAFTVFLGIFYFDAFPKLFSFIDPSGNFILFFLLYIALVAAGSFIAPDKKADGIAKKAANGVRRIIALVLYLIAFGVMTPHIFNDTTIIVGWFICAIPSLVAMIFSKDFKESARARREIMQGTEMGARIISFVWFWAISLVIPLICGPAICLLNANALVKLGHSKRDDYTALSHGEEMKLENDAYTDIPLADRIADSILDMTSNETTGFRPSPKGVLKTNEFGELVFREEGTTTWKKATRVGSDKIEIDGKLYDL